MIHTGPAFSHVDIMSFCGSCRGADKTAKDVLGQKPLDMLIRKGKVSDDELLMMLS